MDWPLFITVLGTVAASSGLWAFVQSLVQKKSAITQLVLGLAHNQLVVLGMEYIERGWVTKDEYDDFIHYLWKPYSRFGGNGLADKVKKDVDNLPIYSRTTGPIKVTEESDDKEKK